MRKVLWGPLVSTFLLGCGVGEPGTASRVVVSDSAGVEIISNGIVASMGELALTETLRLGVLEGEGPEQFSQIYAVALGPDGGVAVANNGSTSARIFGPDGQFEAEVGGRGQGPAETTTVNDVLFVGDTVIVIDWQRGGKAVAFSRSGAFLSDWSFLRSDGQRAIPAHRGPEGWLAQVFSEERPPPLAPGEGWQLTFGFHRMDFGSDGLGPRVYEAPSSMLYGVDGAEMGVDWGLLPETWHTGFDADGRLYVTDHVTYRIDVRGPEGLIRSVRKAYDARPFTDQDVDDIMAASVHVIDTMSQIPEQSRPGQVEQIRRRVETQSRLPRPATVPPLGGLLVSPDGSFWIERWDVHPPAYAATQRTFGFGARVPQAETTWELFDVDGVYRGSVVLPARFRPDAIDNLTVVGVGLDEFDVEYVVRYEVGRVGG